MPGEVIMAGPTGEFLMSGSRSAFEGTPNLAGWQSQRANEPGGGPSQDKGRGFIERGARRRCPQEDWFGSKRLRR